MKIRGIVTLLVIVAAVILFVVWIPALKYFLMAALALGVVVVLILRAWYARRPLKEPGEDVKLHLND